MIATMTMITAMDPTNHSKIRSPNGHLGLSVVGCFIRVSGGRAPFVARSLSDACVAAVKSRVPRGSVTVHPFAVIANPPPTCSEAVPLKAARLLTDLADFWTKATPEERREIAQNLFREVRVRDDRIIAATLAHDDHLLLIASATARDQVVMARPEGAGRALATYEIRIEGRDEWITGGAKRMRDGYLRGSLSRPATQRQTDVLAAFVAAGGSVQDAAGRTGSSWASGRAP